MSTIGNHGEIQNDLSSSQLTETAHEQPPNDNPDRASSIIEKFTPSEITRNGSDTEHHKVDLPSQIHLVGMDSSKLTREEENVNKTLEDTEYFNQPTTVQSTNIYSFLHHQPTTPINVAQEIIRMQQNSKPFVSMKGDRSDLNGLEPGDLSKIESQQISEGIARNNRISSVQYYIFLSSFNLS